MTELRHQLQSAWSLVQQGSCVAGVDGLTVDLFAGVAGEQLAILGHQLHREAYQVSPSYGFFRKKKSGGQRLIGIPTVRDRIVQRWLLQQSYPQLEQAFSPSAFAYRPGLSIYRAVDRVMERYQHQPSWVVKADIHQFFDHLVWALVMDQLEQLGLPTAWVGLLEQHLKAPVQVQGALWRRNRGVLQGGILSGAIANLYLSEFDHRCRAAGIDLVRYGDDMVAVFPSGLQAQRALSIIQSALEDHYLQLHPDKTQVIAPHESFVFLGHQFACGTVIPPRSAQPSKKSRAAPALPQSRPPKVCSLVPSSQSTRPSADDYWSQEMSTLYITEQGAYLRVQNQQFQVLRSQELRCSVPVNQVSHVVIFGCCNVSHGAMSLALRRRIPMLYLANNGKYFGRLETSGQAQIRYLTQQVTRSLDVDFRLQQAKTIIAGKLHNSRTLLQRLHRRRKSDLAKQAIAELPKRIDQVEQADSIETMLGYEGQAAHLYFQAFASLLKGSFQFEKRTRRPPTDPVNSLLSLGYTLLSHNLHSMVEASGLHTHFGNLHTPRDNHPALVSDLIEEFRAFTVDALVAYLINSNIFTAEHFTPPDARGGVYLHPDALKTFLKHWEDKLQTSITHPHTGYKVSYRRCLELQVWDYVACLMGERDRYRPMRWDK